LKSDPDAPLPDAWRRALLEITTSSMTSDQVRARIYLAARNEAIAPVDPDDGDADGSATYRQLAHTLHMTEKRVREAIQTQRRSPDEPDSPVVVDIHPGRGALRPAPYYDHATGLYSDRYELHLIRLEGRPIDTLRFVPKCQRTKQWGGDRRSEAFKAAHPEPLTCDIDPADDVVEVATYQKSIQQYCARHGQALGEPEVTTLRTTRKIHHVQVGHPGSTGSPSWSPAKSRRDFQDRNLKKAALRESAAAVLKAPMLFPREDRGRPRARCTSCGNEEWTQFKPGVWECRFCGSPPGAGSDWITATS
jgi:hypothetical protein